MRAVVVTLLLALCIASVQLASGDSGADETNRSFAKYTDCAKKENITLDEVENVIQGNIEAAGSNPNLKCFIACIFEHIHVMENCEANDDILNYVTKEVRDIYEACKSAVVSDERCECAFQLAKCMEDMKKNM